MSTKGTKKPMFDLKELSGYLKVVSKFFPSDVFQVMGTIMYYAEILPFTRL